MKIRGLLLILLLCLCFLICAGAEEAADITNECSFACSTNQKLSKYLFDGDYKTCWFGEGYCSIEIETPLAQPCHVLYLQWDRELTEWQIEIQDENGEWVLFQEKPEPFYFNQYVALKQPLTHFRLKCLQKSEGMRLAELTVLSAGEPPSWVQNWKPFEGKADLMVLVAHPDDELLFMGGIIPYYRIVENKKVIVCYMAMMPGMRKCELLDGLWHCGIREYPVVPPDIFPNIATNSIEECFAKWKKDRAYAYVVSLIRQYRPDVVVTHDIAGEYGHGAHKACASILRHCAEKLGSPDYYPESAEQFGVWEPKKLYLHLYQGDLGQIDFDWRIPMENFEEKSIYEIVCEAFAMHRSQNTGKYVVEDFGKCDNSLFGLYASQVGSDTGLNDLFENIP